MPNYLYFETQAEGLDAWIDAWVESEEPTIAIYVKASKGFSLLAYAGIDAPSWVPGPNCDRLVPTLSDYLAQLPHQLIYVSPIEVKTDGRISTKPSDRC